MDKKSHRYEVTLKIGSTKEKSEVSTKIYKIEIESLKMAKDFILNYVFMTYMDSVILNLEKTVDNGDEVRFDFYCELLKIGRVE
ncbi:MAG: hypothetical protein OH338_01405 [Candidatus Parvarchaeota archaeon]|jgi:hypothetical protein|nr:hypothetical protein [Candidatus Parvarchaeum tengchongense]MCW1295828.1 hypothetical protein [Candidatus Parvarchaeum tengchongense]MCW1298979.1 hypothetical protein [Candidatus Parvarchaeum tengchongense]MCW1312071.1 hypothetical protein [Candidatus Parvarchaeum tengchongense]